SSVPRSRPNAALAWGAVTLAPPQTLDVAAGGSVTPELLLARFGLESFRPGQREAVEAALAGRDSLVVMPTGGGKSLCYQLPALALDGLAIVISPLVALMRDQGDALAAAGHGAARVLNASLPPGEV